MARESIQTELGEELQCTRCREFWPADDEFFSRTSDNRDGFKSWCKACLNAYDRARAAQRRSMEISQ